MAQVAERVVRDFCEAMSRQDVEELLEFFHADAVYHYIPVAPVKGLDQIRATFEGMFANRNGTEWEITRLVANGRVVFREGIDHIDMAAGRVDLPMASVWEIDGGKISAVRIYFDMGMHRPARR